MLNGLYGYIFGGESADSSIAQEVQVNGSGPAKKMARGQSADREASEWILVGEEAVRKASAEAGPPHLLDECKSLSSYSNFQSGKRSAELQQKRLANAALQQQRQWLTKMMFSDPDASKHVNPTNARLKRACKVELVQSQTKTKPRSKKSAGAKFNANRNNDRKCNPHNLD
uniref:Uncharacterized protein n=1 Tax=Ditylenchus dipsaci TaxID=166011 RepID=A0A915EQ08_9BILA